MRIERELMRGAGPLAVLRLLKIRGEMYGYEIVDALAKQTAGALEMGQSTLYPMLYNLEGRALITSTWREADTGRRRKYYSLTRRGDRRLVRDSEQLTSLVRAMTALGVLDIASLSHGSAA